MQRLVFITIALIITGVMVLAAVMQQARNSPEKLLSSDTVSTSTPVVCQIIDLYATPNLKEAMAVENIYAQMPVFKTPVVSAVQEKPFNVGCLPAGE